MPIVAYLVKALVQDDRGTVGKYKEFTFGDKQKFCATRQNSW